VPWPEGDWSKKDVNNWTKSGADTACSINESRRNLPTGCRRRYSGIRVALTATFAAALLTVGQLGQARDRGQYANSSPELRAWFESLKSGKGPCCSDADGSAVSDVDWDSSGGHYRVRLEGEWIVVPDDAVITTPNRVGRTMVWPMYLDGRPVVRCFMPGSMT
jgi:hypothetical protein